MAKREYTKDGLTVLWDSDKCEHCEACWRNLPTVFDPNGRPWVRIDGAPAEEIVATVSLCPTGALLIKETEEQRLNREYLDRLADPKQ